MNQMQQAVSCMALLCLQLPDCFTRLSEGQSLLASGAPDLSNADKR